MRSLVAFAFVLSLAAASYAQIGPAADTGAVRARTPSTLAFLAEPIDQVAFEDAPLDQVLEWLASLTPMNVVVRWQILEESGIERDKPITMNVRNLRLSQVLWMLMDEAGGTDIKLAYRASGELLIISTEEDLGQEMVVRVYDVSDLLVQAPYFTNAPHMDLAQQGGGSGSGNQNIFGGAGGSSSNEDDSNRRDGEENEDMTGAD